MVEHGLFPASMVAEVLIGRGQEVERQDAAGVGARRRSCTAGTGRCRPARLRRGTRRAPARARRTRPPARGRRDRRRARAGPGRGRSARRMLRASAVSGSSSAGEPARALARLEAVAQVGDVRLRARIAGRHRSRRASARAGQARPLRGRHRASTSRSRRRRRNIARPPRRRRARGRTAPAGSPGSPSGSARSARSRRALRRPRSRPGVVVVGDDRHQTAVGDAAERPIVEPRPDRPAPASASPTPYRSRLIACERLAGRRDERRDVGRDVARSFAWART